MRICLILWLSLQFPVQQQCVGRNWTPAALEASNRTCHLVIVFGDSRYDSAPINPAKMPKLKQFGKKWGKIQARHCSRSLSDVILARSNKFSTLQNSLVTWLPIGDVLNGAHLVELIERQNFELIIINIIIIMMKFKLLEAKQVFTENCSM